MGGAAYTPSTPIAIPGRLDAPMSASMPDNSPMMTPPVTLDASGRPVQSKKNKCAAVFAPGRDAAQVLV